MENNHDEYLTVNELSSRIKYAKQSIYNMIHRGTFIQGIHFIKPSRKKVLFKLCAVQEWMEAASKELAQSSPASDHAQSITKEKSLINI